MTEVPIDQFEELGLMWLTLNRTKVAPKTTGRRLTSLRAFAKWAGQPGMFADYNAPTPAKSIPHPLPEGMDGVRRMLAVARNERQRALVVLGGFVGLRVGESLAVCPHHFDLNDMLLTVQGKGDKRRVVPVSDEAWEYLASPTTRAFLEGMPVVGLRDRFARRVITDMGRRAKLQRHVSSHDLRATFATAIYDKTGDLRLTQELLGHASSTQTEVYTMVTVNKMKEAVNL